MQPLSLLRASTNAAHRAGAALLLTLALTNGPVVAQDVKAGAITIGHAWARATPAPVRTTAAYLTLDNKGGPDRLLSASADVAKETQLHNMVTEAGVMKMREVKGIDIAGNGKTELKPGGYHVMLIGLANGLKEGTKFPLKLKFEKAGEVTVQVIAERPNAHDHGHGEHKH